jgi:hypothetical protein
LRAGLIRDYNELCRYPYSGHSAILGNKEREWQEVAYVLGLFGEGIGAARRKYREYVKDGVERGKRAELVGGGLLRSQGGWTGVKALRKAETYQKGDERILGEGAFVERVLAEAEENFERRYRLAAKGYNLNWIAKRVGELLGISCEEILEPGRVRGRVKVRARNLLCYWATRELGIKQGDLAKTLRLTQPAISIAVMRGTELIREHQYTLEE